MKIYYFKPFLPINHVNNFICFGIPSSTYYFEIEYSKSIHLLVDKLIDQGITNLDISQIKLYQDLFDNNLLYIPSTDSPYKNDNRNSLFIQYIISRELTPKEKKSKILIFGAGAGGSSLCYQLFQLGFESITIVDFDKVNISDLSKSLVFRHSDIGCYKVVALKRRINNDFNQILNIQTCHLKKQKEMRSFILDETPDLIIKAADPQGLFRYNLNLICFSENIPYLPMAYSYNKINLGPLYLPKITGCDLHLNEIITKKYGSHYDFKAPFQRMYTEKLVHPSTTMLVNLLSSFVAMEILFFTTKNFNLCKSLGKLVVINPISLRLTLYKIPKSNECNICSLK